MCGWTGNAMPASLGGFRDYVMHGAPRQTSLNDHEGGPANEYASSPVLEVD
jgi:hypothetical protein